MTTRSSGNRKIGEIARATGMTVRTLRYYEEIGLITPESRTDAGHRLYGPDAVARLYKISLLRQLGLPLNAVQASLEADRTDHDDTARDDLRTLMAEHLADVDARLAAENRLRGRLVKLVGTLESTEDTTGDLLSVLEDMTMLATTLDRRIAILVYEDIQAAYDYLINVFGFGPGELTLDPDGNAVHAEIQAGDGEFWLHTESDPFGQALTNPAIPLEQADAERGENDQPEPERHLPHSDELRGWNGPSGEHALGRHNDHDRDRTHSEGPVEKHCHDGGSQRDSVGGNQHTLGRSVSPHRLDPGPDEGDRADRPRHEQQPQSGRDRVRRTAGQSHHGGHAGDGDGTGQLRNQSPAPRPHVVPELDRQQRRRHHAGNPETVVGEEKRAEDQAGQNNQFDGRHPGGELCAREAPVAATVDQHDSYRRASNERHHRGHGDKATGEARRDQEAEKSGFAGEAPPSVFGRHRHGS